MILCLRTACHIWHSRFILGVYSTEDNMQAGCKITEKKYILNTHPDNVIFLDYSRSFENLTPVQSVNIVFEM